ncbi:type IV toxin-antitoxin system AbiEi family antitoxin domain-containing protein [Novosphingobium terrae]|uniref:type IV toxin-antitoxin system AbiEi family antitoxin domain-containing protein n=1 Tax=Novosphingobium terrae TaxID=2726189 RepID=UPI0019820626|nr:AbiEi antitoxin N-terminal domain-containing protein [Novosphingobium terrae]
MIVPERSQRERLLALFQTRSVMKASEIKEAGITAAALSKAIEDGDLERISRGLYQRCNVDLAHHHALAVAAMRVPKGVIAMLSALAFHELTVEEHPRVWIAIGANGWAPAPACPPLRIVRFTEPSLSQGVEQHSISGINVPIYSLEKTLIDVFRHPRLIDREVALCALNQALQEKRVDPEALQESAHGAGILPVIRPFLAHSLSRMVRAS